MKVDLKENYENGILVIPSNGICCYACRHYSKDKCDKLGKVKSVVSSRCDDYFNIIEFEGKF